jgi:hypothetical protein
LSIPLSGTQTNTFLQADYLKPFSKNSISAIPFCAVTGTLGVQGRCSPGGRMYFLE